MASEIDAFSYYNFYPSYEERMRVYIGDSLDENQRETAAMLAESFQDPNRALAHTVVLIPVAAHQDSKYVYPTLREYAQQKNAADFSVLLYLNSPWDGHEQDIFDDSLQSIERAQADFPNLDVRSATMLYDELKIGQIRADLWNSALLVALHEGNTKQDFIGINNDIDTMMVSPHYIARIQQHYEQRNKKAAQVGAVGTVNLPVGTRVSHGQLASHPNVAKVTSWIDNSFFQSPGHATYEAGMVFPLSYYATKDGFDNNSVTHETAALSSGMHIKQITSAQLYTSPRRYIERLVAHDTTEIWNDETFGPNDACRDLLPKDISFERAQDLILGRLDDDISGFWLLGAVASELMALHEHKLIDKSNSNLRVLAAISVARTAELQLAKADRFLRKVVGSTALAEIVTSSYDPLEYAQGIFEELYSNGNGIYS